VGPGTVAMIDLRLPTGSPTTSTTRLPPSALLPPFPPSGPQSAPNPPGGRPARRAERRRRTRGRWAVAPPASVSRNVDAAAAAAHAVPLAPPACRRAQTKKLDIPVVPVAFRQQRAPFTEIKVAAP
jgi:hypothetical protein